MVTGNWTWVLNASMCHALHWLSCFHSMLHVKTHVHTHVDVHTLGRYKCKRPRRWWESPVTTILFAEPGCHTEFKSFWFSLSSQWDHLGGSTSLYFKHRDTSRPPCLPIFWWALVTRTGRRGSHACANKHFMHQASLPVHGFDRCFVCLLFETGSHSSPG